MGSGATLNMTNEQIATDEKVNAVYKPPIPPLLQQPTLAEQALNDALEQQEVLAEEVAALRKEVTDLRSLLGEAAREAEVANTTAVATNSSLSTVMNVLKGFDERIKSLETQPRVSAIEAFRAKLRGEEPVQPTVTVLHAQPQGSFVCTYCDPDKRPAYATQHGLDVHVGRTHPGKSYNASRGRS